MYLLSCPLNLLHYQDLPAAHIPIFCSPSSLFSFTAFLLGFRSRALFASLRAYLPHLAKNQDPTCSPLPHNLCLGFQPIRVFEIFTSVPLYELSSAYLSSPLPQQCSLFLKMGLSAAVSDLCGSSSDFQKASGLCGSRLFVTHSR